MGATFFTQLKVLLWRNYLLKRRNMKQLWQEIFFPLMYLGILVMIRALIKPTTKPAVTFPVNSLSDYSFNTTKTLYVVSNGLSVNSVMTRITAQLDNMNYQEFANESAASSAYAANSKTGTVAATIVFGYQDNKTLYQYAIRMPHDSVADTKSLFALNQGFCRGYVDNYTGDYSCQVSRYLTSGFAYLQKIINHALMEDMGLSVPDVNISVQQMPKLDYTPDISYLQTISSIYFVLAYSFFVNFLTVNLVAEKEKKIRDGMFMMGLRNSVFWLSWSTVYFLIILIVTSIVTLIAALGKFFENSNMFLLWLMLMMYGLSIIAFAFFLTPFFKKARVAGFVASFATIIFSLVYLAVSQTRTITQNGYTDSVSPEVQWVLCLLSPVALALAMDRGLFLDIAGKGMTFGNMDVGDFPLYAPFTMLLIDIILYFTLAIYLDHVIPGEYGVRYKPWYFLQKSYWFPVSSRVGEKAHLVSHYDQPNGDEVVSGPNIEPVPANMHSRRTMRVINISKSFKMKKETVRAVRNLSLDMYEGQITCLLGHNGAGKTTLINMMTGIIPPTSGTATIRGLDVSCSGDMEEIRSMCGICPQHNILYDELSAKEHLQIFAGIKGVPADKVESEVNRALNAVDLSDQAEVFASKLSGGQKRKLSVAMALIGDPKIIFLDEPTAGMDPYSRRHLWSLLKSSKEGRLILLTTHFMDEADILSDRKAIISKGQLKCCGSSLFLKSKFGIGYHLNMVVEPSCNAETVTALLNQHVGGVEFQRSHGKELAFTIPISEVSSFANLFKALETREGSKTVAENLGILNYGVSMPTLEEVFLKLGEDEESGEENSSQGQDNRSYQGSLSHVAVDFIGRKRDDEVNIEMRSNHPDPSVLLQTLQNEKGLKLQQFWAIVRLRFLQMVRSKAAFFFMLVLPVGLVAGAMALSKQNSNTDTTPVPHLLSGLTYAKTTFAPGTSLPDFFLQDSVNDPVSQAIVTELQNMYVVDSYTSSINLTTIAPHYLGADLTSATTAVLDSYTALYNDTALHSLPAIISSLTLAILGQQNSPQNITAYSLPWPEESKKTFDNGAFSSALMVGMAFALIAPGFAIGVIQEIQWKCKSQMRVSGVSFHMYWGSTFLFFYLVYLIPATACLIIALAMGVPSFQPAGAIIMLILLFILFIPECLLLALLFTFVFDKYETAQAVLPNIFTMGGMVPYMAVSMLDMLVAETTAEVLHYIFVFVDPIYIIFGGFYYIDKVYRRTAYTPENPTIGDYFKFENNIVICLIAALLDFVVIYLLMRILEVRKNGGTVREALRFFGDANSVRDTPSTNSDPIEDEDEDVAQERRRIEQLEHGAENSANTVAYVRQIRKEFIKSGKAKKPCVKPPPEKVKVAVRNLSFAVNKGEVFGLLGPNGAGKTTALSMMTAEVHPSQGMVVVGGHHIRSNMSEAFQALGFCPQHDALWEMITLEEHLELYASIKGIPRAEIPRVVDFFVENLKVQEHRKKHAKKLSGGTKRKLSYAMAMLGCPRVVLLDEPSTGMDPQSKRFLWDTISSSFEGQDRGAILTTHYMEEADALCTRVAIMVNGQMECLGPTQHLKTKYGSGYLLEVKIGGGTSASREELEDKVQELERHLMTLFPNATCLESFAERAQYKIPQSDVGVLSVTFAALEDTKQSHGVEEYSFSQSTLEQVFLNFAKKQLEEDEDAENAKKKKLLERQLSQPAESPRGGGSFRHGNSISERL